MSVVWDAVHSGAIAICPSDGLRLTNLVIAAGASHSRLSKRRHTWNGELAYELVMSLALSPLSKCNQDKRLWQKLAELATDAVHLGMSADGMHSWAAAFQRASTTQKALGAYATHNAFASVLSRITMAPLQKGRAYRIVDPSVGAGNLLLATIEQYGRGETDAFLKKFILSLHGTELDHRARELCCLLIWLFGADCGVRLKEVAANIRIGNALTLDWWGTNDLFEVLLMNPPWESLRHKVTEGLDVERAATLKRLASPRPGAPGLPPLFSAQGKGDRNLFKAFVELVPHLLVNGGRLGALLPSAFASDAGLTELRERYLAQFEIARWTSYENRAGYFPIDSRYKFGLLAATRSSKGTKKLLVRGFAVEPDEVDAPHISLNRSDITLIGRKYHIIPELSQARELEILRTVLRGGAPLFEPGPLGKVVYRREVDLSLDRELFHHIKSKRLTANGDGTYRDTKGIPYVPLIEGRSVGAYDCSQKSWVSGNGRTAVWRENSNEPLSQSSPQYVIAPAASRPPRVAFCDVTASTNTRTVIATRVPPTWQCGNTAPVLEFENELYAFAALGIVNTLVFDWVARRLASGLHLNKFILEGFVWPRLDTAELEEAALAAWDICVTMPRAGLNTSEKLVPPWKAIKRRRRTKSDLVTAAATLEVLTATRFGLSSAQLSAIYDTDRSDRRGFWRYFDAVEDGKAIADRAVKLFGSA